MKSSGLKLISIALAFIMLASSFGFIKSKFQKNYVQRDFVSTELQISVLENKIETINHILGCTVSINDNENDYYIGDFVFNGKAYDVLLSKIEGEYVYSFFHYLSNQSVKSLIEKVLDQHDQAPDKNTLAKNHNLVVLMYCSNKPDFNPFLSESKKAFFTFTPEIANKFTSSIFVPPCQA